jgi:hypothetical protein
MDGRLGLLFLHPDGDDQIVAGFEVARLQSNRFPKLMDGLVEAPLFGEHETQIAVGFSQIGLQSNRFLKLVDGLVETPLFYKRVT